MTVIYTTTLKNNRLDEVTALIDAGTGPGKLEIGTTGMALILATVLLNDPAAPAAASGVLTFTMPQSDTSADNTGEAAEARIRDSDNNDVVTGLTVGIAAEDVVLDSVSITSGQTVTINSATITHG